VRAILQGQKLRRGPSGSASPHVDCNDGQTTGAGSHALEDVLGGDWRGTSGTRAFVVERTFDAALSHGTWRIGEYAERIARGITSAAMLNGGRDAPPPLMFFDLETTGFNGGAGTLAFLVGCGWFDDAGTFCTRQYLLADREPAMLNALAADFEQTGTLVSFNGKSFDAPLLEMRCLFHRLPWFAEETPHVDVLHPSRRFWRHGEMECSLAALERHVLGFNRSSDVMGIDVPARYFRFVRAGDARPLAAVLEHNRRDLLSLAGLTASLLHLATDGHRAAADAREALALGRLYLQAQLTEKACAAFQCALSLSRSRTALRVEALRGLAETRRRTRAHAEAAECWRELLDLAECPGHVAHEAARALAIHHEHRVRDLRAAQAFARYGLERSPGASHTTALQHRLGRLERKLRIQDAQNEAAPRLAL
jgi:uncharacterized protein YprB with RNaseH-like and TPR domain